jgi:hypothetical protein
VAEENGGTVRWGSKNDASCSVRAAGDLRALQTAFELAARY